MVKKKKSTSVDAIRAFLEKRDAYTLHRTARKRFARIPCSVTNVMDLCECYLLYVQCYPKYNDNHKYIPSVIDVFWKFLYLIPVKTKTSPSVFSAFRSIFNDLKYARRPVCVLADKGKEFLNKHFHDMLRNEDIQLQVCKNSVVRSWNVDIAQYKYFTDKNTFR